MSARRFNIFIRVPNFSKLKVIMKEELQIASTDIKNRLLTWVRENTGTGGVHYTKRTGDLMNATKVTGDLERSIHMFVDRRMVKYGEWILSGKRKGKHGIITWGAGDPFIQESMDANKEWIDARMDKAISGAISRFKIEPLREVV